MIRYYLRLYTTVWPQLRVAASENTKTDNSCLGLWDIYVNGWDMCTMLATKCRRGFSLLCGAERGTRGFGAGKCGPGCPAQGRRAVTSGDTGEARRADPVRMSAAEIVPDRDDAEGMPAVAAPSAVSGTGGTVDVTDVGRICCAVDRRRAAPRLPERQSANP